LIEQLPAPEDRFRQIIETLDAIVWEADPNTFQFTFVSQNAVTLLGYPIENWLNEPDFWVKHLHPEDRDRSVATCLEATRAGRDHQLEYRAGARNGRTVWLRDNVRVVKDADGRVTLLRGIMVDITEQRELEERLRQSHRMEAVGSLAGGVAHDFNNLLTVILGQCELLAKSSVCGLLQEQTREILKAADQAHRLTTQLLAFGHRLLLEPKVLLLRKELEKSADAWHRLCGPGVELRIMLDPLPLRVHVDPAQLEQMIHSLVSNACESVRSIGKITIDVSGKDVAETLPLDGFSLPHGRYAVISVSDNGVEMTSEMRARIFEPFYTTNTLGRGAGLGLAAVYGSVKQSGGFIVATSQPGQGNTIRIYLPRTTAEVQAPVPAANVAGPAAGTATVLLVEDHKAVRQTVRDFLQTKGYQVLTAEGADEAHRLSAAHDGEIHLLITDVVMPVTNGPELARQLTAVRPDTRVLFISGYPDYAVQFPSALAEGAALLQKPFRLEALARKVREMLGTPA